jgi:hypothetical protein
MVADGVDLEAQGCYPCHLVGFRRHDGKVVGVAADGYTEDINGETVRVRLREVCTIDGKRHEAGAWITFPSNRVRWMH